MAGLLTMAPPMAPTNTPQAPNGSTSDSVGTRKPPNSTLLFGFLVSFLALFIIFMIFGLGSRHYLDLRRRQRRLFEASQNDEPTELQEPELWDVSISSAEKEKWEEIMPLSAAIQHDHPDQTSTETVEELQARQTLLYLSQLSPTDRFFYSSGELFHKLIFALWPASGRRFGLDVPRPTRLTSPTVKPESKTDEITLQVSILVAMPSPRTQLNDTDKTKNEAHETENIEGLPDIAIGVTSVPWDKERADFR